MTAGPDSRHTADAAATTRAAAQGGVLTHAQALEAGVPAGRLRALVASGAWHRVRHGTYAPVPLPGDPAGVLREQVAAVQLRSGAALVAHGRTAAALHGIPLLGPVPVTPELVLPSRSGSRHDLPSVRLPRQQVVVVGGVRVTTLARTALDVARTGTPLDGVVAVDAVLARGVPRAELESVLSGSRRRTRAAQALRQARPGTESALETLGRVRLVAAGLPEPDLQVDLRDHDGLIGRVDQLWRRERVVAEADGLAKYDAPGVLRAEKLREDRLRDAGYEVVRYTWDEAWHRPDRLAARVRLAMARQVLRAA